MADKRLFHISNKMYKEGLSDEQFTMDALQNAIGGVCVKGTKYEDVNDHIDFWWTTPKNILIGIDAKGLHKNKRGDKSYSDNHWIEVKNVQGYNGWIYGKADYISFRTQHDILFVKPQKLIDTYNFHVASCQVQHSLPYDCFVPYQRNGRKDLIFKVSNNYLKSISSFSIKIC